MANEVQTRTGHCPTHGTVEATREMPKIQFPFIWYGMRRYMARRRPFLCPNCGEAVATS